MILTTPPSTGANKAKENTDTNIMFLVRLWHSEATFHLLYGDSSEDKSMVRSGVLLKDVS